MKTIIANRAAVASRPAMISQNKRVREITAELWLEPYLL